MISLDKYDKDVFIDVKTYKKLIYGTYSIILSKKIARYILNCGLESIVKLNLSWDLFLNHIRDNTDHTTFLYFKELFIPDVMKDGIQPQRSMEFYKKNNMNLDNYVYLPEPEPTKSEPLPEPTKPETLPEPLLEPVPILHRPVLSIFKPTLPKSRPVVRPKSFQFKLF